MSAARLLAYCRAGFEKECAQELSALAGAAGADGFVKARPDSAFAVFHAHDDAAGARLASQLAAGDLVFARQLVRALDLITLDANDRVAPIAAAVRALGERRYASLWLEMPDTNEGKALAALTRTLAPHLERALRAAGVAFDDAAAAERLHVFFVGGLACYVGTSSRDGGAAWPMGIPRLRMPPSAPSRSTLKLAEAFLVLLAEAQDRVLAPGMRAIDLGASPGGWTWQLVRRGLMVTSVDNGPMDAALMDSGQVRHRREDGFGFEPGEPADWMVCDMVESPSRVARLAGRWIAQGWCKRTIFNLKLPMKRRWEEVERCRALVAEALSGAPHTLRIKHLYHDREEVTAYLSKEPLNSKARRTRS